MSRRMSFVTWTAASVIACAFARPAFADGPNEIRAVTYDEDAGTTRIHVRGARTPTFTVYKLDGGQLVRVIVSLARPGRYDVKTTGNELIVTVVPRDPAPKQTSPEALARAEEARD